MRMHSRGGGRLALGAILSLSLLWLAGSAHAAGLVDLPPEDGDGPTPRYCPLRSLAIDATVDDEQATIVETRRYGVVPVAYDDAHGELPVPPRRFQFLRSVPGDGAGVHVSAMLGGEPTPARLLSPDEADLLRLDVAVRTGDPAPLRQLGDAMIALEAFEVSGYAEPTIELTIRAPLRERGTLEGFSAPVDWHREPVGHVAVDVALSSSAPLRNIYAPYTPLQVTFEDDFTAQATYRGGHLETSQEVAVLRSTGEDTVHLDLVAFRADDRDGGFAVAMLAPERTPTEALVEPRDVVIALDRSGSMKGEKIEQARAALNGVLDGLRPDDSVALVTFAGEIDSFATEARPATAETLAGAREFVAEIEADGGTNIHDALARAFGSLQVRRGNPRIVVLLTDGQATAGETSTEAILALADRSNEVGARIFTFGIGNNVNTVLLDRLAQDSGGRALYVRPGQDVSVAVTSFFDQIAAPVLSDPVLDLSAFGASDPQPYSLPDLYAGTPVVVATRYATPGAGVVELHGVRGGETTVMRWRVELPAYDVREGYVPRVWATRKVGALLHQVKLGNDDPALVEEAVRLAERWGAVTDFTGFDLDEHGDAVASYSEVPRDVAGDRAVSTSASLDESSRQSSVGSQSVAYVRYATDRTFVMRDGWFTDTAIDPDGAWIDLRYGSEAWATWALSEATLGIGAFFGVDAEVRFEHLGRRVRVTTAAHAEGLDLPTPSEAVVAPEEAPEPSATLVEALADEGGNALTDPTLLQPTGVPPATGIGVTGEELGDDATFGIFGCAAGPAGGSPAGGLGALLLLAGALLTSRRRVAAR